MRTPSLSILPELAFLAPAFAQRCFSSVLTLLCGALLTPGPRTVTAALRVLGLEQGNFCKYHRLFSRTHWSPLFASRLLLHALLRAFLPPGAPLIVLVDDTLERRRSRKLPYRGLFRDPVRSTREQTQYAWGIRWLVFALLVAVPWSRRRWALPFLAWPLLSEAACQRLGRPHRTALDLTAALVQHLSRWLPDRELRLIGDGWYAAASLAAACQNTVGPACLISRLRLDAVLHDFPAPRPKGKRGPRAKKGPRLPKLQDRLTAADTDWRPLTLRWYGGPVRTVDVVSDVALLYRAGLPPVPVRWVLVRPAPGDPDPFPPAAFFSTEVALSAEEILQGFVWRWNIEVTFAELRAHLGFETQRHWSRRAAGRVIPSLCGLYSVVVLLARSWYPQTLPLPQSAWYPKEEASFADVLAAVRDQLWRRLAAPFPAGGNTVGSGWEADLCVIPRALWDRLRQLACYAP